jgi:hypothetical protein
MNSDLNSTATEMTAPGKAALRTSAFRYSAVQLLGSLVLLFVAAPFLEDIPGGEFVEAVLLSLVMVLGVLAVGGRRRVLAFALFLVVPALAAKWGNQVRPNLVPPEIYLAFTVIFFGFMIVQLLRYILGAPRVDANVLCAGVSGYLLLGLLWVPAFELVARISPPSFAITAGPGGVSEMRGFNAFYFSFSTLTTVGYGDISPVSNVARMLAMMEAVTGVFYMALLISRLVSAYSNVHHSRSGESIIKT